MSFNQDSFNYINGVSSNFAFDTATSIMNNPTQPGSNNFFNQRQIENQKQLQSQQQQQQQQQQNPYFLQYQYQQQPSQLQVPQGSQQRRAFSLAYPHHQQSQHTDLLSLPPSSNDEYHISPHSSISSASKDSVLMNQNLQPNQLVSSSNSNSNANSQPQSHSNSNPNSHSNSISGPNSTFNNFNTFNNLNLNSNQNVTMSNSNFNLPIELQGGVSNIFNRRPSYASDVHSSQMKFDNKSFPLQFNNLNNNMRNTIYEDSLQVNTNRNNSIDYSSLPAINPLLKSNNSGNNSEFDSIYISLDDGLLLNKATNTIITSPDLKRQFSQCSQYFGDFDIAMQVVNQLNMLLGLASHQPPELPNLQLSVVQNRIDKLLEFLLKQNEDLRSSNHMGNKNYSLILNKNGRLDIISFPKNSNLQLTPKDLIIIEGDRGKDLVMVLKPVIEFKFALFFNYLKKKLHLKSLEFGNSSSDSTQRQRPHSSSSSSRSFTNISNNLNILTNNAINNLSNSNNNNNTNNNNNHQKSIINEDENFITLPNKQILRFAKPHELNQLILKYNDEIMAYRICLNYSASLNLNLIIKNVEFQFDKKKLIIYYYCLQRLDFRGLIKELFKIYKTRIWLCAILPLEKSFKPLLDYELDKMDASVDSLRNSAYNSLIPMTGSANSNETSADSIPSYRSNSYVVQDQFPQSDQIYQFNEITEPIHFHSDIFSNLINMFQFEISNYELFQDKYGFLNE